VTAQDIITQLYADNAVTTVQTTVLLQHINRVIQDLVKWSRWRVLRSEYHYFLTQPGATTYWIGAGTPAAGTVDTTLDISDLFRIDPFSVIDVTNLRHLGRAEQPMLTASHTRADGAYRSGRPQQFWLDDTTDPNRLYIFPAPDNQNTFQPSPTYVPLDTITATAGGSSSSPYGEIPFGETAFSGSAVVLSPREYWVTATFVDEMGGESLPAPPRKFFVNSGRLLRVFPSFSLPIESNDSNVLYVGFHVYAGTSPNALLRQTPTPIPFSNYWVEPESGLSTSGVLPPSIPTIAPLGGYLIGFRYFKSIPSVLNVDDPIPFPDNYLNVLVAGTGMFLARALDRPDSVIAQYRQDYYDGRVSLIRDLNLSPQARFVRPDPASIPSAITLDPNWIAH
jgi:hypothetical protein